MRMRGLEMYTNKFTPWMFIYIIGYHIFYIIHLECEQNVKIKVIKVRCSCLETVFWKRPVAVGVKCQLDWLWDLLRILGEHTSRCSWVSHGGITLGTLHDPWPVSWKALFPSSVSWPPWTKHLCSAMLCCHDIPALEPVIHGLNYLKCKTS